MRLLPIAAVLLGGCGGAVGGDQSGLYLMTASALDASGCGPGIAMTTPAYFRISDSQGPTVQFYDFDFCTSADASTCTPQFAMPLLEQIPHGWQGEEKAAGLNGTSCTLGYGVYTATLNGGMLHFERHNYSESNVQGVACTTQDAATRGTSMPCAGYELLAGSRVGN